PLPTLRIVETDAEKLAHAAETARAALVDNPAAHVCIVCKSSTEVVGAAEQIRSLIKDPAIIVRQGRNKDFTFAPGVTVSSFRQVKGLEFDVVVVLDPNRDVYLDTTQGRRNLYMVLTRAKDALHLVSAGELTPLLRPPVDGGLIELRDDTSVPAVELTVAD